MAVTTNPASPFWIFADALDSGQIFTAGENPPNICCPTCGPYVIASVETYNKFAEAIGYSETSCCNCCVNTWAKQLLADAACGVVAEPPPPVPAAAAITPPPTAVTTLDAQFCLRCTNNFSNEINSLIQLLTPVEQQAIANVGIVEYGSLNNDLTSNISDIQNLLVSFYSAPGNLLGYKDMLLELLNIGMVIDCRPGQTIIASVETYLKYAEAVGEGSASTTP